MKHAVLTSLHNNSTMKYITLTTLFLVIVVCIRVAYAEVYFVPGISNATGPTRINKFTHVLISGKITKDDVSKLRFILLQRFAQEKEIAKKKKPTPRTRRETIQRTIEILEKSLRRDEEVDKQSYIRRFRPKVFLDSPGGDVDAALEMGRMLRAYSAWTIVDIGASCNSSCVFLLSAGVTRSIIGNGQLGLHRPTFDSGQFATLSKDEAVDAYNALIAECRSYMNEMGISDQVISDMLRTPSHYINFVGRDYAEKHGIDGKDPGWAEWQRAQSIEREGKAFVNARDRQMDCYNNGVSKSVCDERYENECKAVWEALFKGPDMDDCDMNDSDCFERWSNEMKAIRDGRF